MNERGRRPPRDPRVALPPELSEDAHKGDAGRVLCLVGSRAMPGAALLVVRAACRAGAGLVTLGCVARELLTIAPAAAPEVLLVDLVDADWSAPDGPSALAGRRDDARVAGPGLGRGERTRAIVRWIANASPAAPAVLDADALNEVGTALETLAEARAALVLTPHPGEAARLLGRDVPSDDDGRRAAALAIARRAHAVTVLKGPRTVVASADGERVHVNDTGNPGMATGGSGDVLAGILAAYLCATGSVGAAREFSAFDAAVAAVHVHGRAGDLGGGGGGGEADRLRPGRVPAARPARGSGSGVVNGLPGWATIASVLVALPAAMPARAPDPPPPAVLAEWALRRRAVEAEEDAPALVARLVRELASERWTVRARALDVLARVPLELDAAAAVGADTGSVADLVAALVERLDDPHPNVRARALAALRRAGIGAEAVSAARAAALARDALPEVRLELARLAGGVAVEEAEPLLFELAFDGDRRVAEAARAALAQRGAAVLALLERLGDDPRAWLALVRTCARTRSPAPDRRDAAGLTARIEAGGDPARVAVVQALALARGEPADVDALAAGWLLPLDAGPEHDVLLEARRRDLLLGAASEAGEARGLGAALLARLAAGVRDDDARAFLLEGVLASSRPGELVRAALALDTDAAVELWQRLSLRGAEVAPDVIARWLAPEEPPALRLAVAEALDLALRRGGDEALGHALAGLLDDPDARVRELAFRALANAPDARPWLDALFRAWSRLPTEEALRLCDELPRDHAPRPFRDALLALGEADEAGAGRASLRTASVVELLGLFEGDAQVIAALARWLASDLERLTAPGGVEPGLEIRARGLVLALARAADARTAATVERAFDVALAETAPVSIEVAKVVAAALGRTRGGRERLEAWLAPDVPTRVRIEAALARSAPDENGVTRDPRALAVLLERFEGCDGELRRRILTRLGGLDDPRVIALAADVATGPYPLEEAALALATLGARAPSPAVVAALRHATLAAPDLETRRRAIEAAGSVGGAELAALLDEAWSRWVEPPDPDAADAPPPEVRELLREELLLASARAGHAWPRVERELLARAVASAERDLERRFAGRAGPATEFEYRSELALCEELAAAGRLAPALERTDGWWRIDARLALALGRRALDAAEPGGARATRDAAARLVRLAAIGLDGEPQDEDWPVFATEARLVWMQVARDAGDWRSARFAARELVRVWRADELGERTWLRVLGGADPRAGVDPRGFLEASLEQLEALVALDSGDRSAASAHTRRAAALVGRSRRAAEEQERLEALVAAAAVDPAHEED